MTVAAMKPNGQIQLYPVLRLAVFLVAGIVVGEQSYGLLSAAVWFVVFAVVLLSAFFVKKSCLWQTAILFFSFFFLGVCITTYSLDKVNAEMPEGRVGYSAVVVSKPEARGKVVRCDIVVTDCGRPFKVRAAFFRDKRSERLRPGDGITACSVLEKPRNYAASDFDYRRYLLYHGVAATTYIYIDDWRGAAVSMESLSYVGRTKIAALRFRDDLLDAFGSLGVSGQEYAILAAMSLGERVAISDELNDDYAVSGALHVLSLSGLHLSIIYAMLSLVFFRRRNSVAAQVLIICAIWAYVFIVGLPVSAVRSAIMLTVYSFVTLLNRNSMSLNTLAVAAVALLVANPLDFYDVGFQLSFMSVACIVVFYRPLYLLLPQAARDVTVVRWLWQMTAVSVAAQLGAAPLVAYYFGRVSCYFLLSNFVVIPASTVILYGVVLVVALNWWAWLQALLVKLLVGVVSFMNAGVTFIASLPGSSIEGVSINLVQLAMVYVMIFTVYVLSFYLRKMRWNRV